MPVIKNRLFSNFQPNQSSSDFLNSWFCRHRSFLPGSGFLGLHGILSESIIIMLLKFHSFLLSFSYLSGTPSLFIEWYKLNTFATCRQLYQNLDVQTKIAQLLVCSEGQKKSSTCFSNEDFEKTEGNNEKLKIVKRSLWKCITGCS